jgi:hypothetical protein
MCLRRKERPISLLDVPSLLANRLYWEGTTTTWPVAPSYSESGNCYPGPRPLLPSVTLDVPEREGTIHPPLIVPSSHGWPTDCIGKGDHCPLLPVLFQEGTLVAPSSEFLDRQGRYDHLGTRSFLFRTRKLLCGRAFLAYPMFLSQVSTILA